MTERGIFTFYSYKGGCGRTMALSNVAWILASNGCRVLVIDWDLEAPGLHRYFAPFLADPELRETDGVIDLFYRYVVAATTEPSDETDGGDWVANYASIADYAEPIAWRFGGGGRIDLVCAGRQDAAYSTRVNAFDWRMFYERFGGGTFISHLASTLRKEYDYVLIDSRTGVSDTAGICTVQLPDTLLVFFTANTQSIRGAVSVSADAFEQSRARNLRVLPVFTRVEQFEIAKLEATRAYTREQFGSLLHAQSIRPEEYWPRVETPYVPFYAYEETLATFRDQPGEKYTVLEAAEGLTRLLTDNRIHALQPPPEPDRQRVLAELKRVPADVAAPQIPKEAILICHSHVDRRWAEQLEVILRPLLSSGRLDMLSDQEIPRGEETDAWIAQRLSQSSVTILLVSAQFLASDVFGGQEIYQALNRPNSTVFWIPLTYTLYERTPVAHFQAAHDPARPLSILSPAAQNQALVTIGRRILAAADPTSAPSLQSVVGEVRQRTVETETVVSTLHLPSASGLLVGRERELVRLDEAWENPHEHVLSIVGRGGEGKTTLIAHWLNRMAAVGWRGAERVFGWSFHAQKEPAGSGAFVGQALRFFSEGDDTIAGLPPHEHGERLAQIIGGGRNLLLLDGLECLQYPPGPMEGHLKDPTMRAMITALAARNHGLCIVTTRVALQELEAGQSNVTPKLDLSPLMAQSGAELLQEIGVKGSVEECQSVSRHLGGHALAISLMGSYLCDVWNGDVMRAREVVLLDQDRESGGIAHAIFDSYEKWLSGETIAQGELHEDQLEESRRIGKLMLTVLRLMALFSGPVRTELFDVFRESAPIPELSAPIVGISQADWNRTISRLRKLRLIVDSSEVLDVHPLVRERFRQQLADYPRSTAEAHQRLYDFLVESGPEFPDDMQSMRLLLDAVEHGCKAGQFESALQLYRVRIQRTPKSFASRTLGAAEETLAAVTSFFAVPWRRFHPLVAPPDRAYLLSEASTHLKVLGRTEEAEEALSGAAQIHRSNQEWVNLSRVVAETSELALASGNVALAARRAEESVELADRAGSPIAQPWSCALLGDVLHAAGQREPAFEAFREAQGLWGTGADQPLPYDIPEFRYADLMLSEREYPPVEVLERVRTRAENALLSATREHGLLSIALHHLTIARTYLLSVEMSDRPVPHLRESLSRLRQAEAREWLPLGLIWSAARWRRTPFITDAFERAEADLNEADQIAARTSVRWQIEVAVERARLFAAKRPKMFRAQCDAARRLIQSNERSYTPHVSEWPVWQAPPFVGVLHNGQTVGYHRALHAIEEMAMDFLISPTA